MFGFYCRVAKSLYANVISHRFSPTKTRSNIMGKARDSKKETKKEPAMTAKEKKAAKKAKKLAKS